jgi:hypothetical protein
MYIYVYGRGLNADKSTSGKYKITPYTKQRAKDLGVVVKPSKKENKKIDVFDKQGDLIVSIGGVRKDGSYYMDYPNYIKELGKQKADSFRERYKKRHERDRHIKGSAGYYADKLLW